MCGVCGFVGSGDRKLLKDMSSVISHRGPDNKGIYLDKDVGLGHTRLSIIDLSPSANQPLCNEEGDIWVSYNGEIVNFMQLRETLESKGHSFKSNSDTEVIVHAYEEYGDECVRMFDGMFAFALWDSRDERLLMARDRSGIKPLHYAWVGGTFLFASEIKSLLQHPGLRREVDMRSFHYYINLRYVPGENTMFKGVKRLLPGNLMVWEDGSIKSLRYWSPTLGGDSHTESYYVKRTRKILEESVRRHMVCDVPFGICLSGGIDSTTIVALASRNTSENINTFSMGFGNPEDEVEDARLVAEEYGTNHHELVKEEDLIKEYPKMIWYADEPKRNLYPYYLYELASKKVKCVLGGIGGDEVFAGYIFKYNYVAKIDRIRSRITPRERSAVARAAEKLIKFQTKYGSLVDDDELDYLDSVRYLGDNTDQYLITQTLDRVLNDEYLCKIYGSKLMSKELNPVRLEYEKYFSGRGTFIDKVFKADFMVKLPDDFLLVDDRMSNANSVESRVPFLENDLLELSFQMPAEIKLADPNGKSILRKAVKDIIPKKVLMKEKRGFASNTMDTYIRELRDLAKQALPDGSLVSDKLIKKEYFDKILGEVPNPRLRLHYDLIWSLYAAEIWYNMYIVGDPRKPKVK
ncbi:MAG: asparagine synthase (glutamine-hydrolyzing) [Candidatus Altiarchaeales archaeon]|nr:asparagine synthase (glutamine-hydrolyzing) [Candidatus Altiarchaeales archaeon]MBD3415586.1 asparagine synthase (glutamine-hydrolyzing) [Candidatus Altiarchaeales archaeon]